MSYPRYSITPAFHRYQTNLASIADDVVSFRLLYEKRDELSGAANKLKNGLYKIDETREKVQSMSGELEEARVKVTQFQKQCEEFLVIIVQQKRDADEQQKVRLYDVVPFSVRRLLCRPILSVHFDDFICRYE